MNKAESAMREMHAMDDLAAMDSPMHRLPALCKLLVTVFYIAVVVSFTKYDFFGLLPMVLIPLIGYQFALIPVSLCFRKLKVVMPLVCAVGLVNPFFDRGIHLVLFGVPVSGGVVSMVTLMLKGIFVLMASFLLIATTGIDGICRALRQLHFPKLLVSLLMLTYRFISVFLQEVSIMLDAYSLRAPGQKGIHISAWGSFLGQLILRSMDRAEALYESMLLRGYNGEFTDSASNKKWLGAAAFTVCICAILLLMRLFPPISLL